MPSPASPEPVSLSPREGRRVVRRFQGDDLSLARCQGLRCSTQRRTAPSIDYASWRDLLHGAPEVYAGRVDAERPARNGHSSQALHSAMIGGRLAYHVAETYDQGEAHFAQMIADTASGPNREAIRRLTEDAAALLQSLSQSAS